MTKIGLEFWILKFPNFELVSDFDIGISDFYSLAPAAVKRVDHHLKLASEPRTIGFYAPAG
jgi:hypothetical protein